MACYQAVSLGLFGGYSEYIQNKSVEYIRGMLILKIIKTEYRSSLWVSQTTQLLNYINLLQKLRRMANIA